MVEKPLFPGSFLSSGEEFLPGKNAFENHDGNIYSSAIGKAEFDKDKMIVNVSSIGKEVEGIDVGTIIFGHVKSVRESKALISIFETEKNGKKRVISGLIAVLPVFNVKDEYVKFLSDLFKIGDIVKARVNEVSRFTIDLETKSDPSFGVVKGYCASCREPIRMAENGFKCPKCMDLSQRKFSSDYLVK